MWGGGALRLVYFQGPQGLCLQGPHPCFIATSVFVTHMIRIQSNMANIIFSQNAEMSPK